MIKLTVAFRGVSYDIEYNLTKKVDIIRHAVAVFYIPSIQSVKVKTWDGITEEVDLYEALQRHITVSIYTHMLEVLKTEENPFTTN